MEEDTSRVLTVREGGRQGAEETVVESTLAKNIETVRLKYMHIFFSSNI